MDVMGVQGVSYAAMIGVVRRICQVMEVWMGHRSGFFEERSRKMGPNDPALKIRARS